MPNNKPRVTFTFEGRRYVVRADTLQEAKALADAKKRDLQAMKIHRETAMSVNEWWREYLDIYKAGASEKTIKDYDGFYRNAIHPYIGRMRLRNVKPMDCQKVMNACASRSASYAHKVAILLKGMFSAALDNDLISRNPAVRISKPAVSAGTRRALTEEERRIFLAAAEEAGDAGLFCKVIYYCGLRPSEVNRIQGGDYKQGQLRVRGTKTAAAERTVPIPDALHLPRVDKGKLLFTSNGGPRDKEGQRRYWTKVRKVMAQYGEIAEDFTMYCLRHDYCTRLQEAGVPIDVARRLMGHSSVEVTSQIYTHESEKTLQDAAKLINDYVTLSK